jgi:hypothetical protein
MRSSATLTTLVPRVPRSGERLVGPSSGAGEAEVPGATPLRHGLMGTTDGDGREPRNARWTTQKLRSGSEAFLDSASIWLRGGALMAGPR